MGVRGYFKGPRGDLIVCLPLDGGGLGGGDMSVSSLVPPPTLSLPHKGGGMKTALNVEWSIENEKRITSTNTPPETHLAGLSRFPFADPVAGR